MSDRKATKKWKIYIDTTSRFDAIGNTAEEATNRFFSSIQPLVIPVLVNGQDGEQVEFKLVIDMNKWHVEVKP